MLSTARKLVGTYADSLNRNPTPGATMGITTTRHRRDLGHVGRSVVQQARRLGLAPSSLRRWITVGKELSSGRTLQLAATVTPETV